MVNIEIYLMYRKVGHSAKSSIKLARVRQKESFGMDKILKEGELVTVIDYENFNKTLHRRAI